jgi:formylglycine-generating enzyme required for sulfatase activity
MSKVMKKDLLLCLFLLVGISTSAQTEWETKIIEVNGVPYALSPIKGGTFTMGADKNAKDDTGKYLYEMATKIRVPNEVPARQVTLSDFWMGQTEVTRALWQAVMGKNYDKSYFTKSLQIPVHNVSWEQAKEFCKRLSKIIGETVRLPTEAEWEYVYRGGSNQEIANGGNIGWNDSNSNNVLHEVAQKKPNKFLVYDMSGNVWEWCEDCFQEKYHPKSPVTNPVDYRTSERIVTSESNWDRVVRGSNYMTPYISHTDYFRSTLRYHFAPDDYDRQFGFRIVIPSKEMEQKMTVFKTVRQQQKRGTPAKK